MKKILFIVALFGSALSGFGQIKISQFPTFTGNPSGGWVPIVISGTNRKIDAAKFTTDLSGIYTKAQTDSIASHLTLQTITSAGNTSTNSIGVINSVGGFHEVLLGYDSYSGNIGFINNTHTKSVTVGDRYVDSSYTIDLPKIHIAPTARATIPYSVNGIPADTLGNIPLTFDTTAIPNFSIKVRSLFSATSPVTYVNGLIAISNAAADGSTKGAASFGANDFDASGGNITIDHANIQKASGSQPGELSSSDWTTFNNKQAPVSVIAPVTLSGASVGIVNQSTNTNVLHGNASGNATFSKVVDADISGRIDSSHMFIQPINTKYPVHGNATNDTLSLSQSYKDSLLAKGDSGIRYITPYALSVATSVNYAQRAYPLLGGGILAEPLAGGVMNMSSSSALTDQTISFTLVYLPQAATITGVMTYINVQGSYTANNTNCVALYSLSGGTMTLIDQSANDGNLWKATSNTFIKTPLAATHALSAGVYVVALLYCRSAETTAPSIGIMNTLSSSAVNTVDFANSVRANSTLGTSTTMPSTKAFSLTSNTGTQRYVALY